MTSTLSPISGTASISDAFKMYQQHNTGSAILFQWDDFFTNSDTSCQINFFEQWWSELPSSSCPNRCQGQYCIYNTDKSIAYNPIGTGTFLTCMGGKTINSGGTCSDSLAISYISEYHVQELLQIKSPPMNVQDYEFDPLATLESGFDVTNSDGLRAFFYVLPDIENDVTCELLDQDGVDPVHGTQADGTTALTSPRPHVWMNTNYPFEIYVAKNVPTGYIYDVCVKCQYQTITPRGRVAHTHEVQHQLSLRQNKLDCSNTLDPPAIIQNISFLYNSTASQDFNVQSQITGFTNWDTFFQNSAPIRCPITACWLLDTNSGSNLTKPMYMDVSSHNIFAKHQSGGTYDQYYTVHCINYSQESSIEGLVTQHVDCTNTLTNQIESDLILNHMDGVQDLNNQYQQVLIPPSQAQSFTNWATFFEHSKQNDCPIECGVFEIGCVDKHSSAHISYTPHSMSDGTLLTGDFDAGPFVQIKIQTDTGTPLDETLCVKCQTIQGSNDPNLLSSAQLDNWTIKIRTCEETLITQTSDPLQVTLKYERKGPDQQIYPDSSNQTLRQYFQENTNCEFASCEIFESGTCISNTFQQNATLADFVTIEQNSPWPVFAKTSILGGYQIKLCVACTSQQNALGLSQQVRFWDNWEVIQNDLICQIQVNQTRSVIQTYRLNSGTNFEQVFNHSTFQQYYVRTSSECNITGYRLVLIRSDGEIEDFKDEFITMDQSFDVRIDTRQIMSKRLYIEATIQSNSTALLEVFIYVRNFLPYFKNGQPEAQMVKIFKSNSSFTYQIPEVEDDEEIDDGNIKIVVSELNTTFMSFDKLHNQVNFFGLSDQTTGNYTIKITLEDSQAEQFTYKVSFCLSYIQNGTEEYYYIFQKNQATDQLTESELDGFYSPPFKSKEIEIEMKPITANGILNITFSENLKVPKKVQNLLDQRYSRLLSELDVNSSQSANETLDAYLSEVFNMSCMQYFQETDSFRSKRIEFNPHLIAWNEELIQLDLNFSHPLQVSRDTKNDQMEIEIIKQDDFLPVNGNDSVKSVKFKQNGEHSKGPKLIMDIPMLLPKGINEKQILETVNKIKDTTLTICIIQIICQIIMKNSQGKLILLYMSVQLTSCLYLFSLSSPSIVQIVLKEIWNFVNFTKYKPLDLWIFFSSLFMTFGSEKKFNEIFLEQTEKFENNKTILDKMSPLITLYSSVILSMLISLTLCITQKSRSYLFKYYRETKQSMIWNGFLAYFDGFLISYCLQFSYAVDDYSDASEIKHQVKEIFKIIFYTNIVFVSQIIIVRKLKSSSVDVLESKESRDKIGYLTKDFQLRESLPNSKYFLSLSMALRTFVVFTTLLLPKQQVKQLTIFNLLMLFYLVTVKQIGYYNLSKLERYLRTSLDYLISICFLVPFIFIGHFIDPDLEGNKHDDFTPMEWEGFLQNEEIHFSMGFLQISLFCFILFIGILNMLVPFYRLLTLKNIEKLIFKSKAKSDPEFLDQVKNKSTEKFDLIYSRKAEQDKEILKCKEFCKEHSKPICSEDFIMSYGHLPNQKQRQLRAEQRLRQLKYIQLGVVLSSEMAFMEKDQINELKMTYVGEQQNLVAELKKSMNKEWTSFEVLIQPESENYLNLTVYEAMDIVQKDMIVERLQKSLVCIDQNEVNEPQQTIPTKQLKPLRSSRQKNAQQPNASPTIKKSSESQQNTQVVDYRIQKDRPNATIQLNEPKRVQNYSIPVNHKPKSSIITSNDKSILPKSSLIQQTDLGKLNMKNQIVEYRQKQNNVLKGVFRQNQNQINLFMKPKPDQVYSNKMDGKQQQPVGKPKTTHELMQGVLTQHERLRYQRPRPTNSKYIGSSYKDLRMSTIAEHQEETLESAKQGRSNLQRTRYLFK